MLDFFKRDWGIVVPLLGALVMSIFGYVANDRDNLLWAALLATAIGAIAIHSNYGWRALAEDFAADLDRKEPRDGE